MADEEHLRILREGVDRWNQWRKTNPYVRPNFINAKLRQAALSSANLHRAYLPSADLRIANLSYADLSYADLSYANLRKANLSGADLSHADLSYADLRGARLCRTNLRNVNFLRTQALSASFREAELTGACIEEWHTNHATELDDVICEYIFLRSTSSGVLRSISNRDWQERRPSDRTKIFAPGEFTKLFQKFQETVDLIFSNGIDWKAFAISLEDLRVQYGEQELSIQAIENKNDAFVIRLNVPPDADKGAIERQAMDLYETRLTVLEAQYRSDLQAKDEQIAIYREQSTNMTEIVKLLANRPIDVKAIAMAENKPTENYSNDLRGANIANYANKLDGNARQQAKQYNYTAKQKQTLAEAAADIQQLLEQLSQTYPTTTQSEKLAVAAKAAEEIEANPVLRSRVIGALKAGGVEALKELVDHPLVTILLAALEGWQKPE